MTAQDITLDLFYLLDFRANLIVPNVSWGLFAFREVDMLKVTKAGYAHDYEIKVSIADLKRDQKKRHSRRMDEIIRSKTYVMPEAMRQHIDRVPSNCGIIFIRNAAFRGEYIARRSNKVRKPTVNKYARKLTDAEIAQVARLGAMRIPNLMMKVRKLNEKIGKGE